MNLETAALQTGGSLGTLVILVLLFRPLITKFFSGMTDALKANAEALDGINKSVQFHDHRAERRSAAFGKRMQVLEEGQKTAQDSMKVWQARVDKQNSESDLRAKEYGDTMVKLYQFLAEKAGYAIKGGE